MSNLQVSYTPLDISLILSRFILPHPLPHPLSYPLVPPIVY